MQSKNNKFFSAVMAIAVIGVLFFYYKHRANQSAALVPEQLTTNSIPETPAVPSQNNSGNPTTSNPPATNQVLLKIPFTSQAPTGNWDTLHNEACEEAAAIMANAYLTGDTRATLPASEVEKQIGTLTDWQQKNFGYNLDTTAAETAKFIEAVYGLKTKIVSDYTESDLKMELAAGHPVILPVNGQLIGNPYYKQPGPIYHMLLVRGYTATKIITNDSGTRHGENYLYSFNTLSNAAADWNHSTNTIDSSKKVMIVVYK
ncbi:MAG: hypothetical protein JWO40_850 [Candidatus Doudnabacteria bacterium]|nr:hypothetical protein [Candidatus Doudnabacteria bacterium]